MLDDMLDYLEHLRERPVWQPIPPAVRASFQQPMPTEPTDLATVHDTFMRDVLPFAVGNAHPGFMGWVHGGGTPVGMLAEMLAAGLNANLGGRDQIPIEVERQIVQWMRELFGFPTTASGLFVTGTSMANLIAVLVARTAALGDRVRQTGIAAGDKQLIAYTSAGAHGCIAQALDLVGLGIDALRIIPVNDHYQMDVEALEQTIAADRRAGLTPFFIAGTAGTVDVGAIDNLSALADIAARESLWFHIDGAYGVKELTRIREEPATDTEVEDAKKYLLGSLPFRVTTNDAVAGQLLAAERYGLGFDFLEKYKKSVAAVTVADVQRVAKKHLQPGKLVITAVGPIDAEGQPLKGPPAAPKK